MATGLLSASSLASCALGSEDFVAPAPTPIAADVDATSPAPARDAGTDAHAHGGKDDARAPVDGGANDPDTALSGDDSGAGLDATLAVDAADEDAGSVAPDAGSATCDGLPEWSAGTTQAKVKHYGEKYTCLVEGWCSDATANAVAAYEPGKGWAWADAWQDSGTCQ